MKTSIRYGTEGPSYDPYAYTEYLVLIDKDVYILHQGLAEYIKHDGKIVFQVSPDVTSEALVNLFEGILGITVEEIEAEYQNQFEVCKRCGSTDIEDVDGYPGETLYLCKKCNNICACVFDKSAVE